MLSLLLTIIFGFGHYQNLQPQPKIEAIFLPSITNTKEEFEMREIAYQEGFKYTDSLVRIAICESKMGKYRKNFEGSSAEGILMFMPKTFNAYCQGNIKNDGDQVRCFIKLYEKHKSWWECR